MSNLLLYAIPFFVLLMGAEIAWAKATQKRGQRRIMGYEPRDTLASLAMGLGSLVTKIPFAALLYAVNSVLYEHRVVDLPKSWLVWPLLIVSEDFCYYWFHRTHHEVRVLWASHVPHHSSTHFNLSTALRQPWLTFLTGALFWMPLPLVGFSPEMILAAQAISLIYQFWIHTESIDRLGPLEWIFNTPSHHRVHHGRNDCYLDRNHGGIFIIWDRLFGTFKEERDDTRVKYGITMPLHSYSPLMIFGHEIVSCALDVFRAKSHRERLGHLIGPPGWHRSDPRQTSKARRDTPPTR